MIQDRINSDKYKKNRLFKIEKRSRDGIAKMQTNKISRDNQHIHVRSTSLCLLFKFNYVSIQVG